MNSEQWMSVCHEAVHRLDRDRLMCAMVAPLEQRTALLALLAFNLEIARIPELVSEPMLGEIRLQWWRDTVADLYGGNRVDHPVALGLAHSLENAQLSKSLFAEYLDARALDVQGTPPASLEALESYAGATAGALHELMAEALGLAALPDGQRQQVRAAVRHGGIAWALVGLPRSRDIHAADLEDAVRRHIDDARRLRKDVPKSILPVMLPVSLAEYGLRCLTTKSNATGVGRLFRFYAKVLVGRY